LKIDIMNKKIATFFLHLLGWKAVDPPAPEKKCIILGVPHTSAWDFIISALYYASVGGKAYVMVKKEFFFWPIKNLLKRLGGLPIDRKKGYNVVRQSIHAFETHDSLHLAIAPEGTRKPTAKWKTGFYTIAEAANVPVYLGYFDWKKKEVSRGEKFVLSGDKKADMKKIRQYYKDKGIEGKHPKNFITGSDLD